MTDLVTAIGKRAAKNIVHFCTSVLYSRKKKEVGPYNNRLTPFACDTISLLYILFSLIPSDKKKFRCRSRNGKKSCYDLIGHTE